MSNLNLHKIRAMDNTFIQEKLLPWLTFNPGLALTGFRLQTFCMAINQNQIFFKLLTILLLMQNTTVFLSWLNKTSPSSASLQLSEKIRCERTITFKNYTNEFQSKMDNTMCMSCPKFSFSLRMCHLCFVYFVFYFYLRPVKFNFVFLFYI